MTVTLSIEYGAILMKMHVVYDSEFDGNEYCDKSENTGEYISAEE